jgi:hypothetical protein
LGISRSNRIYRLRIKPWSLVKVEFHIEAHPNDYYLQISDVRLRHILAFLKPPFLDVYYGNNSQYMADDLLSLLKITSGKFFWVLCWIWAVL